MTNEPARRQGSWRDRGIVALATLLLVAHKPWALRTPQLWAEDGSVFLAQNDQLGARAFFVPSQGYLHLLPRLIAWAASRVADVAVWPLLYNVAALLVTWLLFARMLSPRLALPGKPWLVLAFAFAVHTGEVLLNITNLQWLTVFFLVQQLFMAPPTSARERVTDLVLMVLVGLTGPFALLLLPLFVGRWWRERRGDTLAVLLVVAACAALQAWFILKNPAAAAGAPPPLRPLMLGAVLGSRLVIWPLFGPRLAEALPLAALALGGAVVFGVLAAWVLRPHPRRLLRAQILCALVLLAAAGAWRVRPDTWETANLANGDRYFFIPRVLLAWLLIWECDAQPRVVVAWIARVLCLGAVALELPQHRVPAPPDYHWAEHCDAIRRGAPARIPTLPEGWTFEYAGRAGARPN